MGKYGRPKLSENKRRTAKAPNVRLNEEELEIVGRKAGNAGVTMTEWMRLAALERDPLPHHAIPELNGVAWLELSKVAATVNGALWRFQPGDEDGLHTMLAALRCELAAVRNDLIGSVE